MDSRRSIGSSLSSELETLLLRSDDEEASQKIENLSEHLDSSASASGGSSAMEIDRSNPASATIDNNINTVKQNEQNVNNDQILRLLLDIKESHFTKKEGVALKKTFDSKFTAINTELKVHNERITDIDERMSQFESKLATAAYDRELQKQQSLKNNISIFGCPKQDNENVTHTAINIFKAFGAEFTAADFEAVYRTTGRKPNFSSIIVKFVAFEKKLIAINLKAKKPIKVNDVLGGHQTNVQIYLNKHVTPFFGRLLAAGRQAKKDEIIHSCWIGTTGCLLKIQEDGKPVNIRSIDDFDSLRVRAGKQSLTRMKKRSQPDDPTSPADKNPKKRN